MMIHDRMIACHFHLTKSKFGFLNICIPKSVCSVYSVARVFRGLNAERRRLALRELGLEDRFRHEDRREQVDEETDRQRRRETPDGARAELEEERGRDERRDVRVEQGQEHAAEARVDRRAYAALRRELFLDALEDQHVRV